MPSSEKFKEISKKVSGEKYNNVPKGYEIGKTKYVIITGSVMSGVGKGSFSSSIGNLLKMFHGLKISPVKYDGYLNQDAGTLNPFRHGEVFVLDDGTECDLDLGTYERMLNQNLLKDNYLTAGKLFKTIIDKERAGDYLGRDVQFIPHVTGEIKAFVRNLAVKANADIVLIEVGGTIGDLENSYFIEAMRELAYEEGRDNICFVNVSYIIQPKSLGEQKSKPAQVGMKLLMGLGIQPDVIVCRSEKPLQQNVIDKLSMFSNVPAKRIVKCSDLSNIYNLPLFLKESKIDETILDILKIESKGETKEAREWKSFAERIENSKKDITIGITGKYTNVHDSYMSILKALEHTAPYYNTKVEVEWIETTDITKDNVSDRLKGLNGIIVPGGFGARGTEGKIECIRYARENDIPFLGLCYGFQMATIEFARNVCGLPNANSTEIEPETKEPVICILPEQEEIEGLGGTMRLGGIDLSVKKDTKAFELYGKENIKMRFRHRFNVNTKYIDILEENGLVFSGYAPKKRIMQILELPDKKFFMASQYHPEFTSKPLEPNPMFRGFIEACLD
ncbi:MAG: CTP synthase (glutamine hydrolyzing) [Candidatus Aenigmarchaeota archaeon]|nr:CTP synthase (glutamine hydrolyzing) [Candidatus Aenigmarchaeota archaeon]